MSRTCLEYSATAWDPHLTKDIKALEMIQRRGARFVKQKYDMKSSVTILLHDLQWAPLLQRRRELRLPVLYQFIRSSMAIPVEDILTRADQRTRRNHPQTYRHLHSQSEQYRQSFFPRTVPEQLNGTCYLSQ